MNDLMKPSTSQEYAKLQIKGEIKPVEQAVLEKFWRSDSTWIAKGTKYEVEYLRKNRLSFARQDKLYGIQWLGEVFPEVVQRILAGEIFTIDSFQKLEYYKYLVAQLNPICHTEEYNFKKAIRHNWVKKFCDLVRLCHAVRRDGLTAPLDMFMENGHPVLTRGYRRLEILYQLGIKRVPVRVWRNEWLAKHFIPSATWNLPSDSIHGIAVKQFIKYSHKATDKYWVHVYTPYYDAHLASRKKSKLNILELGIKEGMSMDLWCRAFPNAQVYGIDIDFSKQRKEILGNERIHLFKFDYTDEKLLKEFADKHGKFDVIIDDGMHNPVPQKNAYHLLWKYLNDNGVYIIEDLHLNYRKKYKDESIMPELERLATEIWTSHTIKSIAFYPNIVFIQKA